jgi:two-component system cell cycle sensor histidine kinase/response regulator CckA
VLYVSGHAEEVIVKRGVLESGIEFLAKPFTAASLLTRVRAVLDAR